MESMHRGQQSKQDQTGFSFSERPFSDYSAGERINMSNSITKSLIQGTPLSEKQKRYQAWIELRGPEEDNPYKKN